MSPECIAEKIPLGYKQTQVGVIPEDWNAKTLRDVITHCFSGATPSRRRPDFFKGNIRWITSGELNYNIISDTYEKITQEAVEKTNLKMVPKNTFLMAITGLEAEGTRGSCAIVGEVSTTNQSCMAIFPNKGLKVEYLFHYYVFKGKELALQYCQGTKQQSYTAKTVKLLPIIVPPLPDQKVIAEALSDADAFIESLEQLIAKKRQIKQGAMQELLRPKNNWEPTSLGKIADPNQQWSFTGGPFGSNLKSSDYTDDGIRIIQLQNIGDGEFKDNYEVCTSIQKADELLSCNIYPGEIILSKMGDPVARACIVPSHKKRYLMCSDGIRLAVDQRRFNTYFVYTLINAPEFRMKAENASTGSTRKRIGLTELRNLELFCPPLSEQTAIAIILSDMDSEIAFLEEKLAKAHQIKQGMMQELLTGKIRLI